MKRATLFTIVLAAGLLGIASHASASPGAHGPNGEHLDGPAVQSAATGAPRMETSSETFELVGRLSGSEFSMFINKHATNEPVERATVELELGNLKAAAPFHEDQGDYAVDDPAFLKALSAPGSHAMVITVMASGEADLLEGTLNTSAPAAGDHGHDHAGGDAHGLGRRTTLALLGAAAVALLAFFGWRASRRAASSKPAGAAQ